MPDINIKPDIALGLKQPDPLVNISNLINTAAGLQSFRKAQETIPAEIEAAKARSALDVLNLQKSQELLPYLIETGKAESAAAQYRSEQEAMNVTKAKELLPFAIEQGKAESSSAKSESEKRLNEVKQSQMKTGIAMQEFSEAKILMNLLQIPDLYMGADGRPDINKLNQLVPLIAPLTGSKFLKDFTELNTAQLQGSEAKNKLDTNIRGIIAGPLGILGRAGEKDKTKYIAALKQLRTEYQNNKDVATYIDSRIKMLEALPANADLPSMAILESESLLSPIEQRGMAPQPGTITTGSVIQPIVSKPSVLGGEPSVEVSSGKAIPVTLAPGSRQVASGRTDLQGRPTYYIYDEKGSLQGEYVIPAGGGQPIPVTTSDKGKGKPVIGEPPLRLPAGVTQAQYEESQKIRQGALQAAATYQNQQFDNNKIIDLAKKASTGVGAETLANLAGGFAAVPWTGNQATYLNELGHYLDKQAASLASTPGFGGTDAARQMAQSVSGTTQYTAESLMNIARLNRALSSGNYLFNQGIENGIKKNPNNVVYAWEFKNKWNQIADVNALKLYDAVKNDDTEQIKQIVKSLGGINSEAYKKLQLKVKSILNLVTGEK